MRIQIVEDDRYLSNGIVLSLQEIGAEFTQSASVHQAKEDYAWRAPDLVILDVNLPDGSGYDYLKWLRRRSGIPVLMLTANDTELDEVTGLSLGADDYMSKPFNLAVLRARIHALSRRADSRQPVVYEKDGFCFDFEGLRFTKDGEEISLSLNEQRLLRLLVENEDQVLTRERLIEAVWREGSDYIDENALSVTMNRLRGKLREKGGKGSCIQTVYGQGYRWGRPKSQ